jgi:hypothetical protein
MKEYILNNLKEYMAAYKHKQLGDFEFNNKLIDCVKDLNELDLSDINKCRINRIPKIFIYGGAKSFFNKYYTINKVNFMPSNVIENLMINNWNGDVDQFVKDYNSTVFKISPFILPVRYIYEDIFVGNLEVQMPLLPNVSHDYFKDIEPSFFRINLPNDKTRLTTSAYIHELTHAMVASNKYVIEEYYNVEVLSIFNELLYTYDTNRSLFNISLGKRLNEIYLCFMEIYDHETENDPENFNEFFYHDIIKYLTSTLKATMLLRLYLESNNKEAFIKLINQCFTGEDSLENVLYDIGVTYEDSIDPSHIRKLIRK